MQDGSQHTAVFVVGRNGATVVFLNLVGGTHLQPRLNFVFAVDGGGQTFVNVSVAFHDTVVVKVSQREVVVPFFVAVGEGDVVLLHLAVLEYLIRPRGIGNTVPISQQVVLCISFRFHHVVDILLGIHHFRDACQ